MSHLIVCISYRRDNQQPIDSVTSDLASFERGTSSSSSSAALLSRIVYGLCNATERNGSDRNDVHVIVRVGIQGYQVFINEDGDAEGVHSHS